ncbi:MAG: GGDEF domain-containing protein [Vulcanococcus sp.]|jgi:diguanylate cyclase (GGDEF)-like protein
MVYPDYPLPADELQRQRNLERFGVLDTAEDEHFHRIVRLAARVLETPIALISLVEGDRQWFLARHGLDAEQTPREMAFCAHAICQAEPLVVPDATQDPRFCTNPLVTGPPSIRFYAGAQLVSPEGHNLGTLCVIDRVPRRVSHAVVETLQDLAQLVERELELRRQSMHCPTTGMRSRSDFLEQAQRELQRCSEAGRGMALLLLDLDHFSQINQHWGYAAGDQVLRDLATTLRGQLRPSDLLGRLADDTFAVLLVDVDLDEAMLRAEALRAAVTGMQGVFSSSGHRLQASGGLTLLTPGDQLVEPLMRRAEQALMLAQGNGHNQIAEVLGSGI